ncbi:hypothetical protein ONS95_013916 [Cadophora gregata]|uniref:uncharacterized protein n=1 Tax=Cadophora gregata TaxID=51156 RepID=UPI0026DC0B8E|nr:uncharacterized protein ONS95_013916 [Cadophora gregata]KAK0113668.1 hypothetical protein ONS96_014523 [Cadophora gregata f. sp. sojae]KAK0114425.1 hypothetical protein ONS95_013916 [Cadophora gregata]
MILSLALAIFTGAVRGANLNLTADGCVDEAGFLGCQNGIKPYQRGCSSLEKEINCFATFCWNKAYQCEYQQYAINYAGQCDPLSPIPFFPAPSNVTSGCSCNLGNVYLAIKSTMSQGDSCLESTRNQGNKVESEGNDLLTIQDGEHCRCCRISESFASLDAICPETRPQDIGFMSIVYMAKNLSLAFERRTDYISKGKCVSELGFPQTVHGASKALSYLAFPDLQSFTKGNKARVTNNAGTISSPPSSAFTWTGKPDSWLDVNRWRTSTPRYTVTAVTPAPSDAEAGATRAGESLPAPTATPTYTLDLDRQVKGHAVNRMPKRKVLMIGVVVFILGCFI